MLWGRRLWVNRTVFSHVLDFVTGLKLAKSQAREQVYVNRFSNAFVDVRRRQVASDTATAMSQMVLSVGGGLAGFAIEGARLTLPELTVVTLRSLRGRVTGVAVAHREAVLAAGRVVLLDSGRVVDGGLAGFGGRGRGWRRGAGCGGRG